MDESNLSKYFGITSGVRRTINDNAEIPPPVRAVISAPCSAMKSILDQNKIGFVFVSEIDVATDKHKCT